MWCMENNLLIITNFKKSITSPHTYIKSCSNIKLFKSISNNKKTWSKKKQKYRFI